MKKYTIIVISLFIVISLGLFFFFQYQTKPKIILKEDLKVSIYEEVTNLSFIEEIKNGTIEIKEETIDTSKLGNQKIEIILKNKYGKQTTDSFYIQIVDLEKPVITYNKNLQTEQGTEIDLLKNVTASDNSKEEVKVSLEGEYDFKTAGEYKIYYVASDSSGNEAKEEAILKVNEKKVVVTNSKEVNTTFTTSKGFKGVIKNGVTYIEGILIANKTYSLPSSYGSGLTKETLSAFEKMKSAAKKDGLTLYIASGFRSYARQKTIYNNYVARDGKEEADTYSARAGYSEHQTGLAFDLNNVSSSFDNTKEAKWLSSNCYKYGFILRYPKGKENETGYIYESWHFRYVGEELAKKLYNDGNWITLESYFGITSKYND